MSMIGHYKMNGDVTDASGNGDDGTPTAITYTTGLIGQAASFNGTTSRIDLSAHSFQLATNTSFTVWLTIPGDVGALVPGIWSDTVGGSYNNFIGFHTGGSGHYLWMENDDNLGLGFGYFPYTAGDWIHLAMTKDGSNVIRCYVDGVQLSVISGTATKPGAVVDLNYFGIGYAGRELAGLADDLRIYDEALALWQIKSIYNFGKGSERYDPWRKTFGGVYVRRAA